MDPQVTLTDLQYAGKNQSKHNDQHAEHSGDHAAILGKQSASRAGDDTSDDEHHRKSQHEERCAGQHPAAARSALHDLGSS
jgi:hypothetical protein